MIDNKATKSGLPSLADVQSNALTLPQTNAPANNLMTFKDTLSQAIDLAKQNRNRQAAQFMAPLQGTVAASDFNSILSNLNQASNTVTQEALQRAIPETKINPANFKEVQGGLFDVSTSSWVIQPQAGGQGTGLTAAIISNPGLFNQLTPSAKTAQIPLLAAAGFDTKKLNLLGLPAAQIEDLTTMGTVQNFVSDLLDTANKNGGNLVGVGGLFSGAISQTAFKQLGIGSPQGQTNRDLVGQIVGTIAKLRGGTSFTPNEQAMLETYAPTINDSDKQIVEKLNGLNTFIANKRSNLVGILGGEMPTGGTSASIGTETKQVNGYTYSKGTDGLWHLKK